MFLFAHRQGSINCFVLTVVTAALWVLCPVGPARPLTEKWMFLLQVKHLEVSCSSMAEDICRKSAIIETYVMDSRIGNAPVLVVSVCSRPSVCLTQGCCRWNQFIIRLTDLLDQLVLWCHRVKVLLFLSSYILFFFSCSFQFHVWLILFSTLLLLTL